MPSMTDTTFCLCYCLRLIVNPVQGYMILCTMVISPNQEAAQLFETSISGLGASSRCYDCEDFVKTYNLSVFH